MPPISFSEFPAGLRTPHVGVEFNSNAAQAGAAIKTHRALLIGQITSAATMAPAVPTTVTNAADASVLCGAGSVLHLMAAAFLDRNAYTSLTLMGVDDVAGTAASGKIALTTGTAAAGTLVVYVGGVRFAIAQTTTSTHTTLCAALVAAINLSVACPCTAAVNGTNDYECDLTAINSGTVGIEIDVRVNYEPDETLPGGTTVVVTPMASGATDPDITAALAAMGGTQFDDIAVGWNNTTTYGLVETELDTRWGPTTQDEGHAFFGVRDTHANLLTAGGLENSKHTTLVGADKPLASTFEMAASLCAAAAFFFAADPARPLQSVVMTGLKPPVGQDAFTLAERNLLLNAGIATIRADSGGNMQIDRCITTYQTNSLGAPDTAYLDATSKYTLAYLRYDWRTFLLARYPRHKLAGDGNTAFGAGQALMTPGLGRGEAISRYRVWMALGLVEDIDTFRSGLIVEINPQDPNRLDFLLPINLVNQLRVTATVIKFTL